MKFKKVIITAFISIVLLVVIDFYITWNYGNLYWASDSNRYNTIGECFDSGATSCKPIDNPLIEIISGFISVFIYIIFEATIIIGIYFIYKEIKRFNEVKKGG